jgi:hypothetical protein
MKTPPIVEVGDRIRITVDLLRMFFERPDHTSEIMRVKSILDADGAKVLVLGTEE